MTIDIRQRPSATIVTPAGPRLDAEVAGDFRRALLQLVEQGHQNLIVDLTGVDFIDSSGLGALVSALKRLKQADSAGEIRLANVHPSVLGVLEIIRLHRVFSPYPSVDDAVASVV